MYLLYSSFLNCTFTFFTESYLNIVTMTLLEEQKTSNEPQLDPTEKTSPIEGKNCFLPKIHQSDL